RFVGGLLDRVEDIGRFLGEVGVDDDDVVLEDDPDVVAPAERDGLVGGADGRVAEEDARCDLPDVVELHLGRLVLVFPVWFRQRHEDKNAERQRAGQELREGAHGVLRFWTGVGYRKWKGKYTG